MIKNYFKTAWKSLLKSRVYSFINILGLSIGLWACMLMGTVVMDELSYDAQWSRSEDLYRILTVNNKMQGAEQRNVSSPAGLPYTLKQQYPEVEAHSTMPVRPLRLVMDKADDVAIKVNCLYADSAVWKMLDIHVLTGKPRRYTEGYINLLISESLSKKYFGSENPVGQLIYEKPVYTVEPKGFLITGVIKDLPPNSHLRAEVVILEKRAPEVLNQDGYGTWGQNYILMKPGTDINRFTAKVNNWYRKAIQKEQSMQFEFQPISEVYLQSDFAEYQAVKGNPKHAYFFGAMALLLLAIACINYINLSTARAATRLRETGVRKILGASRYQIILQFLAESVLFFGISSAAAFGLYQLSLAPVETYLGHALGQTIFSTPALLGGSMLSILVLCLFTGIYPAWLLSGFTPANMKGRLFSGSSYGSAFLRKSLVVVQFSISVIVLVAMIVAQQQMAFMSKKDLGFNKDNLLTIGYSSWDGKGAAFKTELLKQSGVENVSMSTWIPAGGAGYMSRDIENPGKPDSKLKVWYISADTDFAATMGLSLNKGRWLNLPSDVINEDSLMENDHAKYRTVSETASCLLTATTARMLNIRDLGQANEKVKKTPVGVIEDFHNTSLHTPLGPTAIGADNSMTFSSVLVRVKPGAEQQVLNGIHKLWKEFYPYKWLETSWADETLEKQYEAEEKLMQLFRFFSILTMGLAALGVFGLIVHTVQQRTKEIGVRKVLGAPVGSIVRLLSSDLLKLVLLAILIAVPLSWYAMNNWLQDFAYRISISWWVFAVSGLLAVFIALLTISYQTIKAALANPVKSLRTE